MNTGIEILLKRMADCPEDFYYNPSMGESRWARLVDNAIAGEIATQEERELLEAGMKEVRRQKFTESVMKELAGVGDETSDEGKTPSHIALRSGMPLVGQIQLSSTGQSQYSNTTGAVRIPNGSITLGNTSLNEEQLKHMKAHMDALNKVEVRKKATLR
jgi:hypothetical protein